MIPENTNGEIAALKNQLFTLLVALIVVSGTLTVYLYRQVSVTNKDIAQGQQLSAAVAKNEKMIETLVGQLVDYSKKHPDFAPVLKKYGIPLDGPTAPAAPAAPKK